MSLDYATMTADARIQFATPLQREAHERRKRFRARLEEMVERAQVVPIVLALPAPVEATPLPPKPFSLVVDPLGPQFAAAHALLERLGVERPCTRVETIQRVVAAYYGVTLTDIVSARRTNNVVRPRMVAMYLAKQLTGRSLPDIGRRFCKDHTTTLNAIRVIAQRIMENELFAEEVQMLRGRVAFGMRGGIEALDVPKS